MNSHPHFAPRLFSRIATTVAAFFALAASDPAIAGAANAGNPDILPPDGRLQGKSYSEWSAEWWKWAVSIPAAENPLLDEDGTGAFAQKGSGNVWFLAGAFGGNHTREASVPAGKSLFFPLINSLWWAPEDLEFAAFLVDEYSDFNSEDLTDEELIGFVANFQIEPLEELILTIDGIEVENLLDYRTISPGFRIHDTDLLDDLEIPISRKNLTVAGGYWIMLAPLPPGRHTIAFTVKVTGNPIFADFELNITYDLTVGQKKK